MGNRRSKILFAFAPVVLLTALGFSQDKKQCRSVGGMLMTDLGAVDEATTMGYATGDLKGAVAATVVDQQFGTGTITFTVQHHWVTDSGDTLAFDPAKASFNQVAPNSPLYGISSYSAHLSGGAGKFAGATGNLKFIGEADLSTGQLVFRYTGDICFAKKD